MIKLTFGRIRDPKFDAVLRKILNSKMSIQAAKRLLQITTSIRQELEQSDELFKIVRDKFLELVPGETNQFRLKDLPKEEKAEAEQELKDFLDCLVDIPYEPLTEKELFHVELSPVELHLIRGLVE